MNNTLHIWFNGRGLVLPGDNGWEKFEEVDALRVFLLCADSWTAQGWAVKRISTAFDPATYNYPFPKTVWQIAGRVQFQFPWYPSEMWQFIAKAKSVAVPGINWFASMDVINRDYSPVLAEADWMRHNIDGCMSAQVEHFSMAFIGVTYSWLRQAEEVLIKYDRGELPEIRGSYVSDERILREYLPGGNSKRQKFACNSGDEPLVHYARSTLARKYREIQLS